ncbi:MAG: serine protease [Bdellovibrio sp. CG10_big_fil_rev_8_21_14_0_10_47_8]|nr:MAG: serine protease [Bdellovibrio sp. CG10_big_fil_rev_8_21_14_0_10_47_8]
MAQGTKLQSGIRSRISVATLVAVLALAFESQAGTVLHFQNGSVDPTQVRTNMSSVFAVSAQDYVLQFHSSITESDKAALTDMGVQIFRYIPDDALIVRATERQLSQFAATGKVNAWIPFQGTMKLSPSLPTLSVFSVGRMENILVAAFTNEDAKNILQALKNRDSELQVLDQTDRFVAVRMDMAFVSNLMSMKGVEFIQKLEKMESLNFRLQDGDMDTSEVAPKGDYSDLNGFEAGTKVMNFESMWAKGYHGEGQIVSMADTGLDSGVADSISPDFTGAVKSGYSFGAGAKTWSDPMGHGTHVAGSVLGRGTSSGGALKGGAYAAEMVAQGMWSTIIDNLTVPPKLNKLFDAAYNDGARIHTNSWGAARNFGVYDSMAQQVDDFMWNHPDFLILFAAGNSGVDMDRDGRIDPNSVGSPGTAKSALTVGASENLLAIGGIQKKISELKTAKDVWPAEPIWSSKISDEPNGMAMFSSRGPTTDGRRKPEIVAPGTNILSARSHVPGAEVMWGAYNDDYVYAGGTSMATPLTAGAAALTRQFLMQKKNQANPSAALIKATLLHTAFDMFPGQYGQGSATQELQLRPNSDEGYGRVDMKAVSELGNATRFVDSEGVAEGQSEDQTVQMKSGTLLANLVYTDAPGTPSAGAALVNNIDLIVTGPDGKVYGGGDSINNNEVVELSGLKAGRYTISVKGIKIPMGKAGKQPYALVYTSR